MKTKPLKVHSCFYGLYDNNKILIFTYASIAPSCDHNVTRRDLPHTATKLNQTVGNALI